MVVPLAVVGSVGKDPIPLDQLRRLSQSRVEAGCIVAGTIADMAPDPQIRARVAQDGQLRPEGTTEALRVRPLVEVMKAGVTDLEAGGVDRTGGFVADQAEAVSVVDQLAMDSIESPFFRSRFWAFSRVVQWGTFLSSSSVRRSDHSVTTCMVFR